MFYERLSAGGASQLLFEMFRTALTYCSFKGNGSLWLEFGIIAARLEYKKASIDALTKAKELKQELYLADIILDLAESNKNLRMDIVGNFSLLYSNNTFKILMDLKKTVGDSNWSKIIYEWYNNCLGSQKYLHCYELGLKLQQAGEIIHARRGFRRCIELCPSFERARFALGPEINPVDEIDNRALFQALDVRKSPPLSYPLSNNNLSDSPADLLLRRAPHLFRVLVDARVKLIEANDKIKSMTQTDSEAMELLLNEIRLATNTISNIKRKFKSLYTGNSESNRSAFLFSWYGVGDHIYMNGAVRYLSTIYDKVYVGTTHKYPAAILDMYRDDPAIEWQQFELDKDETDHGIIIQKLATKTFGKDCFFAFAELGKQPGYISHYPDVYYDEYGIDPLFALTYFHIELYQEGEELLSIAKQTADKFIFTHTRGSNRDCSYILNELRKEQPETLI